VRFVVDKVALEQGFSHCVSCPQLSTNQPTNAALIIMLLLPEHQKAKTGKSEK
jgi:hypothetical protein